ncbi:hypothetical protein [Actinoalloteichus hymeniacidonis]|uniref:Uncharacterized protein n=1 Tax=Actinoalloteichus hymeniacidonis TaxID=340345 RepID=A0AAC9HSB1_9PSEU|nr:hypothetical protein [Actinoalloteichus hymeniacidonis]AOS64752.1 hypothetical protein TL08_19805 [Actinoalloteichus hymeniacidonis]MBB5907172.1 hypothetical protein [Actinoalloteichus hymeniacidonis]
MTDATLTELISRAYGGDLTRPDLARPRRRLRANPYADLIDEVSHLDGVLLTDYTDSNHMVCLGYLLAHGGQEWALELSLIAPFAIFARTSDVWERLLHPSTTDLDTTEQQVIALLTSHGFSLPHRETLEQPLAMSLDYTDPENVRVYHALFSDEDFLPWEFSHHYRE